VALKADVRAAMGSSIVIKQNTLLGKIKFFSSWDFARFGTFKLKHL
jgi:hypothetical protein